MFLRNSLLLAGLLALSLPALASPAESYDFGQPAPPSKATRMVEVTMTDIAFSAKELDVRAGETVRFVLINKGHLLHEFNLGHAAAHAEHQQEMLKMQQGGQLTATGMNMTGMDHGAMGHGMKHDDPNSVLVEPGKTAELTWTFSQARNLQFACNIPGHYQAGMVGTVKVAP
ncbi:MULTISPECIES: cupredoxin family protein [unclassified Pseudomonas]|uniref:copper-resistant cuproprotein CopI n=1 Tax=unclassified Pseudomonas TaxID=196821 RepID=UPI00128BDE28|nr:MULTISPECIES: cupredoxin family protein [unclassified Pseudomonas]MPQ66344.1 copper-binding protein [Pseudomonas sp. MWU12-2323]